MEEISAKSYLVADIDMGKVYFQKNIYKKLPIASLTKLLTAIVAGELFHSEKLVTLNSSDIQS